MNKEKQYNERVGRRICELIAGGATLGTIEKMPGMPRRRTVRSWVARYPAEFGALYDAACCERVELLLDEAVQIADSARGTDSMAAVAAARAAIDVRKWFASKMFPSKYGDRTEVVGAGGQPLLPPETDRSKVALVLLAILKNARPELEVIDEAEVLEPAPEPVPRRLLLSNEPRDEALLVVEPPPPLPSPRWTSDARGQTRHVSEQRDLFPVRVVK